MASGFFLSKVRVGLGVFPRFCVRHYQLSARAPRMLRTASSRFSATPTAPVLRAYLSRYGKTVHQVALKLTTGTDFHSIAIIVQMRARIARRLSTAKESFLVHGPDIQMKCLALCSLAEFVILDLRDL